MWIIVGGLVFGYGLALSGMAKPEIVISFLTLDDLGLLLVMGGAFITTLLSYQLIPRILNKQLGCSIANRQAKAKKQNLFGAAIFGIGWGITGMCPGAALASLGVGNIAILYGITGIFIGTYIHAYLSSK